MTTDPIEGIFNAWRSGKSALLYGPPGTGKTRILSELIQKLENTQPETDEPSPRSSDLGVNASDPHNPFQGLEANTETPVPEPSASDSLSWALPLPVKKIWLTFHQSFSYEDFVIGLVPKMTIEGVTLAPKAGVLLDAIAAIQKDSGEMSVVIFIDEINRGNAAKIFGEFLTFLDFDYRETSADGKENPRRLPLPLRHLSAADGKYQELLLQDGTKANLDHPSYFPRNIYVVATMNSVDRTAIPIDSALARRFNRIEMRPDLNALMAHWDLRKADLAERASRPADLGVADCALLILDRINLAVAEHFGPDFELGHGLVMALDPKGELPWEQLARIWDETVFPQIEDRFSGRPEELATLLRVEEFAGPDFAWGYRESISGQLSTSVLAPVSLLSLTPELIMRSFQLLASHQPPA